MEIKEWTDMYNPFNSMKLMASVPRWENIQYGKTLPSPGLITVDPDNRCNLGCVWCNGENVQGQNANYLSSDTLNRVADYLPSWGNHDVYKGVLAVCVAGGGEPLSNKYTGNFIERLAENGIESGIVTNGLLMDRHLESLVNCTWVGVSVDAGTNETYCNLKRPKFDSPDHLGKVITNITSLSQLADEQTVLGQRGKGPGIAYKYLMHPENVGEIYEAAVNAKEAGCKSLHIRPFGVPWDKVGTGHPDEFSVSNIETFKEQLTRARELEDENFGVYGVTHKFDGNLLKSNEFKRCYAVFMTAVIQPPSDSQKGNFNLGLCCDRRGDKNLTVENLTDPEQITDFWGSEQHWEMARKILVEQCPRCTYQPHNQIFEKVILEDNTTWKFI